MKTQIKNLLTVLEFNPDTVSSQTLHKNDAGSITLFTFAKGQGLSEHSAPFDAFVMSLEGEVDVKIGGDSHLLKSGDSVIMPANVPHSLIAVTDFRMMLVMLKGK
ncbi:MAG: cupin domain-containing protein [Bacteroidetes bacterium]|nr:cupin domain-containing protein [Bacteroidota bacterium]MBU1718797.1 cupin domain-containing protein [Bacteroidota bacterium]